MRVLSALPLVGLVRLYQLFLSPLLPSSCRFYPSCSAYALVALRRFGPVRGLWLTVRRLGRCHPWNPGGVDHVPRRGADGRPIAPGQWRYLQATSAPTGISARQGRQAASETKVAPASALTENDPLDTGVS